MMIKDDRLKEGMRVRYISHVMGESESGTVSSWTEDWVFVKYDGVVHRHGMAGATAQATRREELMEIEREHNDRIRFVNPICGEPNCTGDHK